MNEALKVIAGRYSELQLIKAYDILRDMSEELEAQGLVEEVRLVNSVMGLVERADNLQLEN